MLGTLCCAYLEAGEGLGIFILAQALLVEVNVCIAIVQLSFKVIVFADGASPGSSGLS
jgi:hypothetical protein